MAMFAVGRVWREALGPAGSSGGLAPSTSRPNYCHNKTYPAYGHTFRLHSSCGLVHPRGSAP